MALKKPFGLAQGVNAGWKAAPLTGEAAALQAERDMSDVPSGSVPTYPALSKEAWKKINIFRLLHGREPTPKELQELLK